MPRRPTPPPPKPADFPPEKTHAALKKQLDALERLRGRKHREAMYAQLDDRDEPLAYFCEADVWEARGKFSRKARLLLPSGF